MKRREDITKEMVKKTLEQNGGNITKAAKELGCHKGLIYNRLRETGVSRKKPVQSKPRRATQKKTGWEPGSSDGTIDRERASLQYSGKNRTAYCIRQAVKDLEPNNLKEENEFQVMAHGKHEMSFDSERWAEVSVLDEFQKNSFVTEEGFRIWGHCDDVTWALEGGIDGALSIGEWLKNKGGQ